jgi:sec-independent protein translocase protein TatB
MFDIGFGEMMVCAIVALVVIGPEKLPRVARTLGHLFGRLQRYVAQVKTDIHREMEAADLGKVKTEFENAARSFQTEIEASARATESEVRELQTSLENLDGASQPHARDIDEAMKAITPEAPTPPPASPQLELGIEEPAPKPEAGAPPKQASG